MMSRGLLLTFSWRTLRMLREMTRAECEKILMVEILRTYLEYLIILVGIFSLRYQFSAGMRVVRWWPVWPLG